MHYEKSINVPMEGDANARSRTFAQEVEEGQDSESTKLLSSNDSPTATILSKLLPKVSRDHHISETSGRSEQSYLSTIESSRSEN